jgi:hypothetical protein
MSTISYEVSAIVREDLCDAFETFMIDIHIPEVMATGAFSSASFAKLESGRYRTNYVAASRESLDTYFAEHAPRLRDHVAETFSDGIEFSREEWEIIESF